MNEKQLEQIAARKAINEAKRAKKPATKAVKKKPEEVVEPSSEAPVELLEQEATNVPTEGENVSTASVEGFTFNKIESDGNGGYTSIPVEPNEDIPAGGSTQLLK